MLTNDQVLGKGRYKIISNYARDDFGGLYEAYDTVSSTKVVIRENVGATGKVATATQLDAINNAFTGEAKALTEVRHDGILSVQDFFSEIDRQYLVMEAVDGYDLTHFLKPSEPRPALSDVLTWTDHILDALHYLHSLPSPLVHRDIRPANIRLTSNFKVKLVTAGIAARDESELGMAAAANPADSLTLCYRPLEQLWCGLDAASQKVIANSYDEMSRRLLGQPLDARSDIYSLGATLYHLLTRTLPKDALERSIELLEGNPDPLTSPCELEPSIPWEISDAIMKALELRRENRFDSAVIMRQVLKTAQVRMIERRSNPAAAPHTEPESVVDAIVLDTVRAPAKMPELEAERLRVEQRQRELEAEQKQLEEEKRRIEQQRIAIDAEQQRQRLREQPADVGRNPEAKAEVPEENPIPVEALADSDEQYLLEIEPVEIIAEGAANSFEWSEDELHISGDTPSGNFDAVERPLVESVTPDLDFEFSVAKKQPSWRNLSIGAGAFMIVMTGVAWVFLAGPSSKTPPGTAEAIEVPAQQQTEEPVPQSAFTSSEPAANTAPTETISEFSEAANTADIPVDAVAQAKQKKTATVPARSPTPQRRVTVDDLINDDQ